jgi:hypothetical protein
MLIRLNLRREGASDESRQGGSAANRLRTDEQAEKLTTRGCRLGRKAFRPCRALSANNREHTHDTLSRETSGGRRHAQGRIKSKVASASYEPAQRLRDTQAPGTAG